MMRFVVYHDQLVDLTHNDAQVYFGIGRFSDRPFPEKIVFEVIIVKTRLHVASGIHAVYIG